MTSTSAVVSSIDIAEALAAVRGMPAQHPTAQQRAVIEAPLAPALVVAGAGSGKTETMANRVLWLLANGLVEPAQVLGLTFTRKAAGELGLRIRERIAELDVAGLLPPRDVFDAPVVATYNSFANTLYRDSAILLTGGFHQETVTANLARQRVSYTVVVPMITRATSDSETKDYFETLLRQDHGMVGAPTPDE